MSKSLDRKALLEALDEIGQAAIVAQTRLEIAIFGGSALMLASNFRFATEDVDIAELGKPWPDWLSRTISDIATRNGWSKDWLNDAVTFYLSPYAELSRDFVAFGTFPRKAEKTGLTVSVPTARYLLALKLKALRVSDFAKGSKDLDDVSNLLRVLDIKDIENAIAILAEFFPKTGADADKQRFVLKHIMSISGTNDAPSYPRRDD